MLHLLNDEITITPQEGYSAYGPVKGQAVTVRGRVEIEDNLVVDADGSQKVSEMRLFLRPGVSISRGDLVEAHGRKGYVISIALRKGFNNVHHQQVEVGGVNG